MNKLLVTLSVLLIFSKYSEQASRISDSSNESDEFVQDDSPSFNLQYFMNLKKLNLKNNNLIETSPCVLNIQRDHMLNEKKVQDKWPLVLEPTDQPNFITVDKKGDIFVKSGEKLRFVCSGNKNRFVNVRAEIPDITVTCQRGKFFEYMGATVNFENFGCSYVSLSILGVVRKLRHEETTFSTPLPPSCPKLSYPPPSLKRDVICKRPLMSFQLIFKINSLGSWQ